MSWRAWRAAAGARVDFAAGRLERRADEGIAAAGGYVGLGPGGLLLTELVLVSPI
ncbi:hypothetical protein IU500_24580 [Nocardia terpenica]|uniref:hypothetical protein n=1 Tax=Nocardia terpenica TaxID=455432 RepID=UPI0018956831|nr:hypothetical protein [Nocardia terpenica]MBF6064677.1 hypothetical protein [Nocardia terpenica]MBF6107193.1 hypothetical protein [Nocardia terpenica]MBF6114951.1 hypothetical protein [Nocardia terpenica]MBF6122056.1 hypothetical protein [Nocardia terpenica]MBF6154439.1 hypothetical protein [Nocardia terpenica]